MPRGRIRPLWRVTGLLLLLAGCKQSEWGWWGGRQTPQKIDSPLAGKKVCILVHAEDETIAAFPLVQADAALHVAAALSQTVPLNLIDVRVVSNYQDSHAGWYTKPPVDIGKVFGADLVLAVNLLRFTTRDEKTPELFRGRVEAACKLYDCAAPPGRQVIWADVVHGLYPPDKPILVSQTDETAIRRVMLEMLGAGLDNQLHRKKPARA